MIGKVPDHSGATRAKIERNLLKEMENDRRIQRWFKVVWLELMADPRRA
jgi:hypothetical protein